MVQKRDRAKILAMMREITSASRLESARKRPLEAIDTRVPTHPKIAAMLDLLGEEMLAVYAFTQHHQRSLRTTNMVERFNEEIRRRTRVIRIFPNEAACVRIVSALAIEINEEWMERKHLPNDCRGNDGMWNA